MSLGKSGCNGFLALLLVYFIDSYVWAQTNECPLPHNDCVVGCGNSCNYWTCDTPDSMTMNPPIVGQLPFRFIWWEEPTCTGRLRREENLKEIKKTYTFGPVGRQQQVTIGEIPFTLPRINTALCTQRAKRGPCCAYDTTPWSACDAVCTGDPVAYGNQYSTVTCPAANRDCCPPQPPSVQGCSRACLPPPRMTGNVLDVDYKNTAYQGNNHYIEVARGAGSQIQFDQNISVAKASKIKLCDASENCALVGGTCFVGGSNLVVSTNGQWLTAYDNTRKEHSNWWYFGVGVGGVKNQDNVANKKAFGFCFRVDD